MNLEELLEQVRDVYQDAFQEAIAERRGAGAETLVLEPVFLDDHGAPVREGTLNLPMRGDVFVAGEDGVEGFPVDSTAMLDFETFSFSVADEAGTTFTLAPFVWDSLEMTLGGVDADASDWSPLTAWFLAWFENDEETGEEDLGGVVHCLTDPETTPDGVRLTVDLGSAPVAAFEDLLAAVQMLGATTCHFASTNLSDLDDEDDEEDA